MIGKNEIDMYWNNKNLIGNVRFVHKGIGNGFNQRDLEWKGFG